MNNYQKLKKPLRTEASIDYSFMKKIDQPFDVSYTISFSGRTVSDGVPTATTPMIKDKIAYLLEEAIAKGWIRDYHISAQRNNIEIAKEVLEKSKKE